MASDASELLRQTEDEAEEEAASSVSSFPRTLRKDATSLTRTLAHVIASDASANGVLAVGVPPLLGAAAHVPPAGVGSPARGVVAVAVPAWACMLELAPCSPTGSWLERAAEAARGACENGLVEARSHWLGELERVAQLLKAARHQALEELRTAQGENGGGEEEGGGEGGAGADGVGRADGQHEAAMEEEDGEEGEDADALEAAAAEEADAAGGAYEGAGAAEGRGRAAARARGQGVLDFWDVSVLEKERRDRQRRATAAEYAALRDSAAYHDVLRVKRLEVIAQVEGEEAVLREEWTKARRERESASRDAGEAAAGEVALAAAEAAATARVSRLRVWGDLLRECEHELGVRSQWALSRAANEGGEHRRELCKLPKALPERLASLENEDEQEEALRADLASVHATVVKQTAVCFELEAEIQSLYEQRRRECRADRAAERRGRASIDEGASSSGNGSGNSGGGGRVQPAPFVAAVGAPPWAAAAAAAAAAVAAPDPMAGMVNSLRAFIGSATDPECRLLHERLARTAPHACAVTLALRLALAKWIRRRMDEAVPAGSFVPAHALLGSRPDQLRWKLEAVRWCASQAGLRVNGQGGNELVAAWLLREIPECIVVPTAVISAAPPLPLPPPPAPAWQPVPDGGGDGGAAAPVPMVAPAILHDEVQAHAPRWALPDGTGVDCVVEIDDEKETVYDGKVLVGGQYDGQVSGASFEPGPWTWVASRGVWVRDVYPHDVLVATPCGHAYSERFWSEVMSTEINRANAHTFRARKARCCAPMEGGGVCGKVLLEAQALRVTGCRCRMPRYSTVHDGQPTETAGAGRPEGCHEGARAESHMRRPSDGGPPSHVDISPVALHGSWGSRVDSVVRLLLALRESSRQAGDVAAAKAVIFSRHEPLLKLLTSACAMNGVHAARFGQGGHTHGELADFVSVPTMQALLLSAQRDASGLTLTAACHVIIVEPQPDVATEQQMVGRVHRIGQTRQTHVHRLVVDGSFEPTIATERLAGVDE